VLAILGVLVVGFAVLGLLGAYLLNRVERLDAYLRRLDGGIAAWFERRGEAIANITDEALVTRGQGEPKDRGREQRELQQLISLASAYYPHMAHTDYLGNLSMRNLDRGVLRWSMRYPEAALALDELAKQHEDQYYGEGRSEDLSTAKDAWAETRASWKAQYTEAAAAYDEAIADALHKRRQFEAIANMPEIAEARRRDFERRAQSKAREAKPSAVEDEHPQ
jgi:hypothetical protein